jgi:predicted esterase
LFNRHLPSRNQKPKTKGLLDDYDAPLSLPLIAPRPLLALNGEHDPRCPLPGVKAAFEAAARAYEAAEAPCGALELRVFKGVGHEFTPGMSDAMHGFFAEWL